MQDPNESYDFPLTLDELFGEIKAHLMDKRETPEKKVRRRRSCEGLYTPKTPNPALYGDPENWNRGQNIALVHKESRELMGVFAEWLHKSVPGVRKLTREDSGLPIHAVEEVSGDWSGKPPKLEHKGSSIKQTVLRISLSLTIPGFTFLETFGSVRVTHTESGIHEVTLETPLSFYGAEKLLQLPAETQLLPLLSLATKVALKQELAL